jgi:adenylate cyclase
VKKIPIVYAIPAGIAAFIALLVAIGFTTSVESGVYNGFLALRPDPPRDAHLVLVDVDDQAVSAVGTWPISRSITADGLLLLKEMGAAYSVFDIEYVNTSPRGVNASVLGQTLPAQLTEGIGKLADNTNDIALALKSRRYPLSEAPNLAAEFRKAAEAQTKAFIDSLQSIVVDNDARLARSASIFGNAFLTINMQTAPDQTIDPAYKKTAVEKFALKGVKGQEFVKNYVEISPVIEPILSQSKGIGFTNVSIDGDGVRRRIDLLKRYGDAVFPQLGFGPFLSFVGNPSITVTPDSFVLKGAKYPDGKTYDVTIPRAEDGSVLINWPHAKYEQSFRHLSFYYLYTHEQLFADLVGNLKARQTWGYLDQYQGSTPLVDQARALTQLHDDLLSGEAPGEAIADYRAGRDGFLKEVGAYLDSKPDENMLGQLKEVLAQKGLSADQKTEYEKIQADLPDWFAKTRDVYQKLMKIRTETKGGLGGLEGTICFLGNTNTGSTDLGTNPFSSNYANLGTHASVVNMLLARQFLDDASPWWSWLVGVAGAFALTFFLKGKKPVISLSVGGGVAVAAVVVFAIVFITTGLYLPVIPMGFLLVFTFLGTTAFQFLNTEKEKGFLRSAFSRYLSNEVIKQIIANPDQLQLGGQEKVMTAVFTDIKGFSTISEKMTATELVNLLNQYLTSMSDIILDLGGTIDKYEGDAIIAFFGAPLNLEDHARRACLAAVRMKRVENDLNQKFLGEQIAPSPLLTRIGINTGRMVVGNMGTNRKMDYTIIGDAVNLAARLEGVNKLYGSWILMSEDTKNEIGDVIVTRKLDRVRVVGKSVPIRLFQAVEEKGHLPEGMADLLETYHQALEHFEERRWTAARQGFEACLKLDPNDGPSVRYLKLAQDYEKTPPPDSWDGVFKMESK